jgi:hypothetical protein
MIYYFKNILNFDTYLTVIFLVKYEFHQPSSLPTKKKFLIMLVNCRDDFPKFKFTTIRVDYLDDVH